MDVVCRDAETLGVKWREHYVEANKAVARFNEIYEMAKKCKYHIAKHDKTEMLINGDYIILEK